MHRKFMFKNSTLSSLSKYKPMVTC
uniref:Uncharacterized protein n=1 Tax=Anguilla anguilla TaxID=7936 RepID=A0A0E9XHV0_ANGAN